jgi:putative endopeptidase
MGTSVIASTTQDGHKHSGIMLSNLDQNMSPKLDFYEYVNGGWIKNTKIPGDMPTWGTFIELREKSTEQLHHIVEDLSKKQLDPKSADFKVATLYADFMNTAVIEQQGVKPLKPLLEQIQSIKNAKEHAELIAKLNVLSIQTPFSTGVAQDLKQSDRHMTMAGQSGLGLPDRDYYLSDDAKLKGFRDKYVKYIEDVLTSYGDSDAKQHAAEIFALETEIAKIHWSTVENRDLGKMYNKYAFKDLNQAMPKFEWNSYLKAFGIHKTGQDIILAQLSYFKAVDNIIADTPLDTWKAYYTFHSLNNYSSAIGPQYETLSFEFYNKTLRGVTDQRDRWKRGIDMVNGSMGEVLGEVYVSKHFTADKKARMQDMIKYIVQVFDQGIVDLEWMSDESKVEARAKLNKLKVKVGYPDKWKDYSKLEIRQNDLLGNLMRTSQFNHQRNIEKLGKPVDLDEWSMTPQTVNAYYHPMKNEIVFPAAILQPPFFDMDADDAVNYGAIGGVIGHEISHGFDDNGSRFDANGNMRNWWTDEDHKKFKEKTQALVEQYNGYEVLPNQFARGDLSLGENIADNSGLAVSYKAYQLSLGGQPAPVIDGLTGDQRFFMGWAQGWRAKEREEYLIERLKTGPHAPNKVRGNGAVVNQDAFFDAFGIQDGDKMYVSPEKRVKIW